MGRAHGQPTAMAAPRRGGLGPNEPAPAHRHLADTDSGALELPAGELTGTPLDARWTPDGLRLRLLAESGEQTAAVIAPGDALAVRLGGPRCCIGRPDMDRGRATGQTLPCPAGAAAASGSRCRACAAVEQVRSRQPAGLASIAAARGLDETGYATASASPSAAAATPPPPPRSEPHAVYLAHYGLDEGRPMLKVGISHTDRVELRLAEQGAHGGIVFAHAESESAARRLELWMHEEGSNGRGAGVREGYGAHARLRGMVNPQPVEDMLDELRGVMALHARRVPSRMLTPPTEGAAPAIRLVALDELAAVDIPSAPQLYEMPEVIRGRDGLVLRGTVEHVTARTLLVREEGGSGGRLIAVPAAALMGWALEPVTGDGCRPVQMGLFG